MSQILLTNAERQTTVLAKLVDHLEARIATLRKENDIDSDIARTAALRGQIKEAKALLAALREKPEFVSQGPAKKV